MRRLDLKPDKKLRNPNRHLRSLRRWVDGFDGFFPSDDILKSRERYWNWRVPIPQKLISARHTTPAILRAVIQGLVDATANLHAARPPERDHMPVVTLTEYPNLFWSEVTLFIDPDYFWSFNPENNKARSFTNEICRVETEPSKIDLIAHYGIDLPRGMKAGGYFTRVTDFDPPDLSEKENWTIGYW